ncbi:hypothetical protein [Nocardioides zeae]
MRDLGGSLVFAAGVIAAAATGVLAAVEPRLAFAAVLLLAGLVVRTRTALALTLVTVCSLGLIRRVTSGGRTDTDPLLLVPIILLGFALLWGIGGGDSNRARSPETALSLSLKVLAALPIASWMISERSVAALYVAVLYSACFVAMAAASSGSLPNLSTTIARNAPWATIALGSYGIVQFQVLPSWDRAWMVASELTSIGNPLPGEVRVFGSLESPGPYALVLGALMCVVAQGLVAGRGVRGFSLRVVALAVAVPPFFLTGVRSALVSLAVVMFVAALKTRSFLLVTVAATGSAALFFVGSRVIAAGAANNIFTIERYTNIGDDRSLAARLKLLDQVGPAMRNPLGSGFGASVQRADNLYVDLLLACGPIALIAMIVVAIATVRRAVATDWRDPANGLSLAVLFSVPFTMAASVFATTSGIAVALAWGWVLSTSGARRDLGSGEPGPVPVAGTREQT